MGTNEELLNRLEVFLGKTLIKEKLSKEAEDERRNLLDVVEIYRLPPVPPQRTAGNTARLTLPSQPSPKVSRPALEPETGYTEQEYADIDVPRQITSQASINDCYEVPALLGLAFNRPDIESDSGTDYESYDEEDGNSEQVRLPTRVARGSKDEGFRLSFLDSSTILWKDSLMQKQTLFSSRRYCAVDRSFFYIFKKSEKSKLLTKLQLTGLTVQCTQRDGSVTTYTFKLATSSGDVFTLETSNDKSAQDLMEVLRRQSVTVKVQQIDSGYSSDQHRLSSDVESLGTSSNEGGSGDGVTPGPPLPLGMSRSTSGSQIGGQDKKSFTIGGFISSTFGRKQGPKALKKLKEMESGDSMFEDAEDVVISGQVKIMSERFLHNCKWHKRWLRIRNDILEGFRDPADAMAEFTLPLTNVKCELAGIPDKPLAVKLTIDKEPMIHLEFLHKMKQGDWLKALVKVTEGQGQSSDQIYSEVEDSKGIEFTAEHHDVYDDIANVQSATAVPPPLPRTSPPRSPTDEAKVDFPGCLENSYLTLCDVEQRSVSDKVSQLREQLLTRSSDLEHSEGERAEAQEQLEEVSKNHVLKRIQESKVQKLSDTETRLAKDREHKLHTEIATLKRQRTDLQLRRSNAITSDEKEKLNRELDDLDHKLNTCDNELTILQMLMTQATAAKGSARDLGSNTSTTKPRSSKSLMATANKTSATAAPKDGKSMTATLTKTIPINIQTGGTSKSAAATTTFKTSQTLNVPTATTFKTSQTLNVQPTGSNSHRISSPTTLSRQQQTSNIPTACSSKNITSTTTLTKNHQTVNMTADIKLSVCKVTAVNTTTLTSSSNNITAVKTQEEQRAAALKDRVKMWENRCETNK